MVRVAYYTQLLLAVLFSCTVANSALGQYGPVTYPCQGCVDGICIPNRQTHGYYPTVWRRWPGSESAAQPTPAPGTGPEPYILPDERQESSVRPTPYPPGERPGRSQPQPQEQMPATEGVLPGLPGVDDGAWNSAPFIPMGTPAYLMPQPLVPPLYFDPSMLPAPNPYAAPQAQYAAPLPQYTAPQYAAPQVPYAVPQYTAPQTQYVPPQPQYAAPAQYTAPAQYAPAVGAVAPAGYEAAATDNTAGQIAPAAYEAQPVVLPQLPLPPGVEPAPQADPASLLPPLPVGTPAPYAPQGNPLRRG